MDEIRAAVYSHMDQMAALFESFGAELRKQWNSGSDGKFMEPILGFIHAVDWTVCIFFPFSNTLVNLFFGL